MKSKNSSIKLFRKVILLKNFFKIDLNKIHQEQIFKIVNSKILNKGNLKSYNFFKNNYQKFRIYFYQFLKFQKRERN